MSTTAKSVRLSMCLSWTEIHVSPLSEVDKLPFYSLSKPQILSLKDFAGASAVHMSNAKELAKIAGYVISSKISTCFIDRHIAESIT